MEAGGVRKASFDELDVDLGLKPRRNSGQCRVSQEGGYSCRKPSVRRSHAQVRNGENSAQQKQRILPGSAANRGKHFTQARLRHA